MDEKRLGGSISLVGFDRLEPAEITIVKKIVGTCVKKLQENGNYKDLKLVLQQHQHGKTFKHEINAQASFDEGTFTAHVTEWNLFKAISEAIEKINSELVHKNKGEKRKEKGIRKERKVEEEEEETEEL
jgi:ribosome-associated translation inhibitor RaiA